MNVSFYFAPVNSERGRFHTPPSNVPTNAVVPATTKEQGTKSIFLLTEIQCSPLSFVINISSEVKANKRFLYETRDITGLLLGKPFLTPCQ